MTSAVCSPPTLPSYSTFALFMESPYSRDSNNAAAPLPIIPRHSSSSSRFSSPSHSQPDVAAATTAIQNWFASQATLLVQPPTPPGATSRPPPVELPIEDHSSSSSSESCLEFRRSRVGLSQQQQRKGSDLRPPEHSTPTPAVFDAKSHQQFSSISWPLRNPSHPSQEETPRQSTIIHKPVPTKPSSQLRLNLPSTKFTPPTSGSSSSTVTGVSTPTRSVSAVPLGRKKSGEPLKSSLKSRRPVIRGDLSVLTGPIPSSKSEPCTPTHNKSVHFDDQLEHVKLFLAEQKPLAVSRNGSPTDTSGTDSDFPAFIYGKDVKEKKADVAEESEEEKVRKALRVELGSPFPRVGAAVPLAHGADVLLESLTLSPDHLSILGNVLVRNIAFEKSVTVRFTFDNWQTTSEVCATYIESVHGTNGAVDRFGFRIRLNDLLMRIREKRLFMAVRYQVAGRELWDNNFGKNYDAAFKLAFPTPSIPSPVVSTSAKKANDSRMADLKNRLELVVKGREMVGHTSPVSPRRTPSPIVVKPTEQDNFSLKSGAPLSARYDFSASLKSPPWKAQNLPSPSSSFGDKDKDKNSRQRFNTYPAKFPSSPRSAKFISDPRGSPRIVDHDFDEESSGNRLLSPGSFTSPLPRSQRLLHHDGSDQEDTPVPAMPFLSGKKRNHTRGYFDLSTKSSPNLKRTPPGTPLERSDKDLLNVHTPTPAGIVRYNSFPPSFGSSPSTSPSRRIRSPSPTRRASSPPAVSLRRSPSPPMPTMSMAMAGWQLGYGLGRGASEDSTPSITSNSSSQSSSRSSSPVPGEGPRGMLGLARIGSPVEDRSEYNVFLNRYCFYTGPDSPLDIPSDAIHRSHSASSVEELLSSPPNLGGRYYPSPSPSPGSSATPTRSSSLDDVSTVSGSSTPTMGNTFGGGSPPAAFVQ